MDCSLGFDRILVSRLVNWYFGDVSIQVIAPPFPKDSPVGRPLLQLPARHEAAEDGREMMDLGAVVKPVGLMC